MLDEMRNIVYELCDLIVNSNSDVVDVTQDIGTPLNISIKPSNSNLSGTTEHTLVIDDYPSRFDSQGLTDIVRYSDILNDEGIVENLAESHIIGLEVAFKIREINGRGTALEMLHKYREHPLVKKFCKHYNMNHKGLERDIRPIPFLLNSMWKTESIGTFEFSFTDSYDAVQSFYEQVEVESEVDGKTQTKTFSLMEDTNG